MKKKILIIEDVPTQAGLVKAILEDDGLEVNIAMTGKEGLKMAREIKPDLILLDLLLPDIDGFEVCTQIKKEVILSKTIFVVLSIKDKIEDIIRAFHVGADDYIIKSPMPEFLSKKINLYLGIR